MTATYYARPLTTKELIRRYVCATNAVGTWIETSVRQLARAVGRSEGQMSYHLKALARDGWFDVFSDHTGTLIEVLRSDVDGDSAHDRENGRSCASDAPKRDHVAAHESRDLAHDRAYVLRKSQNLDQQQQCAGDSSFSFSGDQALYQRLMAEPTMNPQLAQRIAQHPPGTLAEFTIDLAAASRQLSVNTPFWCVVSCWRDGQRFTTREEVSHAAPAQSTTGGAPATQRDPAGRSRRSGYSDRARRGASPYSYERQGCAKPGDLDGLPKVQLPASMQRVSGYGYGNVSGD